MPLVRTRFFPAVLALATLFFTPDLAAQVQATTGVLRGTVLQADGTPVGSASVTLRNVNTNYTRTLQGSNRGCRGGDAAAARDLRRDGARARLPRRSPPRALGPAGRDRRGGVPPRAAGGPAHRHRGGIGGAAGGRHGLAVRHAPRRRGGRGPAEQRAQRLQLHHAHAQRRDRAGPGRRRDQHRRPARHPQQRLGGRRRLQQSLLRRAARRPAAAVHVQPRRRRRSSSSCPTARTPSSAGRAAGSSTSSPSRAPTGCTARRTTSASTTRSRPTSPTPSPAAPPAASAPTSPSTSSAPRWAGPIMQGQGVLLPRLRPAGVPRDQADRPPRPRSTRAARVHGHGVRRRAAGRLRPDRRTNDANAFLAKLDFRLGDNHNATLKYNYTNSRAGERHVRRGLLGPQRQRARAATYSHAVNGSLQLAALSGALERVPLPVGPRGAAASLRRARSTRRPAGPSPTPTSASSGPDGFSGYRFGMPFFIPVRRVRHRFQVLDNVSIVQRQPPLQARRRVEPDRREADLPRVRQRPDRFTSVNGFLNYVAQRQRLRRVLGRDSTTRRAPARAARTITGPVALYLQQAGVGGLTVEEAGTQEIIQNELALFLQDSWKPTHQPDAQLRPALGGADPARPDHADRRALLRAVHRADGDQRAGHLRVPRRRHHPVGQVDVPAPLRPRVRRGGDGRQVVRANAGLYYARIPGLNLASSRSTDGSRGQTHVPQQLRSPVSSAPPPAYGELLPAPAGRSVPPRRVRLRQGLPEPAHLHRDGRLRARGGAGRRGRAQLHARAHRPPDAVHQPQRRRSSAARGHRPRPAATASARSTVVQSSAKSRYNGITAGLKRTGGIATSSSRSTTRCRSTSRTTTTSAIRSSSATPGPTRSTGSTTGATATSATGSTPGCWRFCRAIST